MLCTIPECGSSSNVPVRRRDLERKKIFFKSRLKPVNWINPGKHRKQKSILAALLDTISNISLFTSIASISSSPMGFLRDASISFSLQFIKCYADILDSTFISQFCQIIKLFPVWQANYVSLMCPLSGKRWKWMQWMHYKRIAAY